VETTPSYASDVAFTPSVKALQTHKGSRSSYERMEERGSWQTRITPDLARFIEAQTSIFLGTANMEGQPYIQHRGGPPGFLQVLNDKTIGFADFCRQPAIHHAGQSRRQSQGLSLPDRLCAPAAHQDLG
jgi:predicted pyridoxine 5'-phosphate oxidase superfamily flavin-nucleotide-binding protein